MSASHSASSRLLADVVGGLAQVPEDIRVSDVTSDSRAVQPGCLFLACRGRRTHGLQHVREALARGARAVLWEPDPAVDAQDFGPQVFVSAVPDL